MSNHKGSESNSQLPDQAFRSALRNFAGQDETAGMDAEFSEEPGVPAESEVATWINKNLGMQGRNQ
ncbi:hypothetical protein [Paenibacillus sp. YPG26]|uniref:hypothetical protein n=1 Tax=Paenibacillus sp. YPG26 TaxID=2878915 RepID=UPI00204063F3|nr:hypothetical protein [Paenibacillus sp. YPG26]USB32968.1 hypothetical protein LDO05_17240 [Paenibacillus sp. YPG26]